MIILDHTLDHIVRRADHIVGNGAGLHLRVHDLIGFVFFINYLDTGFFFKDIQNIRIQIFAPVVDNYLFGARNLVFEL